MRSCTIITGEPNEKMAEIHDRMPVMLPPSTPGTGGSTATSRTSSPAGQAPGARPSSLITLHPVSTEVNNVRNQGEHLTDPIELDEPPELTEG